MFKCNRGAAHSRGPVADPRKSHERRPAYRALRAGNEAMVFLSRCRCPQTGKQPAPSLKKVLSPGMEGYDMFKMFKRVGIIYGVVLVAALVLFLATMFPVAAAIVTVLAVLYFLPRIKLKTTPLWPQQNGSSYELDDDDEALSRSTYSSSGANFYRSIE